jgi:hypothetical protein
MEGGEDLTALTPVSKKKAGELGISGGGGSIFMKAYVVVRNRTLYRCLLQWDLSFPPISHFMV